MKVLDGIRRIFRRLVADIADSPLLKESRVCEVKLVGEVLSEVIEGEAGGKILDEDA